ncbi:MAG: hypothetical protein P8P30_03775 [Rickettsiales bacterium]|nr:hypothetical protein [Rickettsiales bacterium]
MPQNKEFTPKYKPFEVKYFTLDISACAEKNYTLMQKQHELGQNSTKNEIG